MKRLSLQLLFAFSAHFECNGDLSSTVAQSHSASLCMTADTEGNVSVLTDGSYDSSSAVSQHSTTNPCSSSETSAERPEERTYKNDPVPNAGQLSTLHEIEVGCLCRADRLSFFCALVADKKD